MEHGVSHPLTTNVDTTMRTIAGREGPNLSVTSPYCRGQRAERSTQN